MDAYIVKGYRTAVGRAKKGGLRFTRPDDMGIHVVKHLMNSMPENFDKNEVDDLLCGNAIPEAEQGLNMARYIALEGIGKDVPGATINRYCASGFETIAMASTKIHAGHAECIVAGGSESMSLIPMGGYRVVPNHDLAREHPDWYFSMGMTSEAVAREYGVTRDDCDEFAARSHQRALQAIQDGKFKDEIVPLEIEQKFVQNGHAETKTFTVDTDESPRPGTTQDKLAKLKPVFAQKGISTAGNSSPTNDGAAFVMVVSERILKEYNLTPIARIAGYGVAGVDPRIMGIGPTAAIPKALKNANLNVGDLAVTELNEAFATQSLVVIRETGLDPETVNPNGGAIALGHPLGCTGAVLTQKALNETRRRNGKYCMVTACVGGGQGIAGILELLN
jgi:acetyl-CoA acyltransferase